MRPGRLPGRFQSLFTSPSWRNHGLQVPATPAVPVPGAKAASGIDAKGLFVEIDR